MHTHTHTHAHADTQTNDPNLGAECQNTRKATGDGSERAKVLYRSFAGIEAIALDVQNGIDLTMPSTRKMLHREFIIRKLEGIMLSPPCTMYSSIQRICLNSPCPKVVA